MCHKISYDHLYSNWKRILYPSELKSNSADTISTLHRSIRIFVLSFNTSAHLFILGLFHRPFISNIHSYKSEWNGGWEERKEKEVIAGIDFNSMT